MGTNLSILQKGLILLAIPLLFQLTFFGVLLKMEWDQEEVQHLAVHTKEVIAQAETSYRYLVEGVSYVRRLVLTGEDPALAPPLHDALEKAPEEFRQLEALVADNPPQQAKAADAAGDADRLQDWLRRAGDLLAAGRRDEAAALVKDPSGQARLDSVRRKLDDFLAGEDVLDQRRTQALESSQRRQTWLIGGGVALSLAIALAVGLVFGRDVSGRLTRLADNVRRLGERKELTQPLSGRDEVARLDRTFRDMARALRERDQENEMFIYSVSHDLRSPLVNLQGFGEELALSCRDLRAALAEGGAGVERARRVAEKDIPDSLHYIKTAVSRLSSIIDALLRLSRVGRVEYRVQAVNVDETVRRVAAALGGTIEARKAEVIVGPLPPALGDPTAVEQIFANLIGNAVLYLDPSRPGRVEIGALQPGEPEAAPGLRTYYVTDNGLGIPEAYQPRVFLAFQRLHAGVAQGEGVGLALVYRIVGRLGGRIWMRSAVGTGSTFYVALPPPPEPGAGAAAEERRIAP